jgi:hypothetical protein
VFKHSSREDDLQYEVSVLRRLEKELPLSCQCWFPEILAVEEERVPSRHWYCSPRCEARKCNLV